MMRKRIPCMLFAIIGMGLLAPCPIQAQERVNRGPQENSVGTYPIYVTGSVVNPIELRRLQPLTLTQAIKLAGGIRSDAKTGKVMIYRQKNSEIGYITIAVDLKAVAKHRAEDPILQPYDIVDVPSKHKGCTKKNPCPAMSAGITFASHGQLFVPSMV